MNGKLYIAELDSVQYSIISGFGLMKWNKSKRCLIGSASMELLEKLSAIVALPPQVQEHYDALKAVQTAVDTERNREHPSDVYTYPVNVRLFEHQQRAANMAQVVFGWLEPGVLM